MEGGIFRLGRPVPPEMRRLVLLMAGLLWVFGGISAAALALFATDLVRYPVAVGAAAAIAFATGGTLLVLHATNASVLERHFSVVAYTLQLLSPLVISAAQYAVGPRTVLPFLLYVEVTIFSFYLMPAIVA